MVETMIGLGRLWEGRLERGSCGLSGGYGEKAWGGGGSLNSPSRTCWHQMVIRGLNSESAKNVFS